jgi:ankyrin repeat protein
MKALRSFYRRTNFSFLRYAAILLFCLSTFTFPLFGYNRKDTDALKKIIKESRDVMDFVEIGRLLNAGADPNGRYDEDYTFLSYATRHNEAQLARVLLEHGADPNLSKRTPPTMPPVFYGNSEMTALLIEYGARFDVIFYDIIRRKRLSPLLYKCYSNLSSALLVLEWEQRNSPNFSANFKSRKEYLTDALTILITSLFYQNSHFSEYTKTNACTLAERLIDAGADPAAIHEDGFPVTYLAIMTKDFLDKRSLEDNQFLFPLLIEKGAPIDAFNEKGETALYCAAFAGNLELAELLLQKGADINQQNRDGKTALMAAASKEVMKFLLDHGADPNMQDNKGRTVLHNRINDLNESMVDDLISRGCLINEPDFEGVTPLIHAAACYYHKAVLLLLEKGADPNYRDAKGRTALHAYLLEAERRMTYDGKTNELNWLLDAESRRWSLDVINALLETGPRPADKDANGDSTLITAIRIDQKNKNTALSDIVQQYADDEEIRIATADAEKMVPARKRGVTLSWKTEDTFKALCVPVVLGGFSLFMREVGYKDDPSKNIMGPINAMLTLGAGGFFLGALMGGTAGDGLGAIATGFVGGLVGGIAGIIVACMPSVNSAFNKNSVFYYAPTIISAIVVSVVIYRIWF